ncbi:ParB/Srx family N-terminal domain-containing protein [uncultured Agitococcus sp.]|uniref:ParB/Srx family N-terminal domain-containing protein n=1 Tax=uncultured Agitococcus sp. TaxID=1506599 RepID=UPI00262B17B1|nr:ParB/Srx family N-terminal domain-containing protein [uncultured Agitococcus sp.]
MKNDNPNYKSVLTTELIPYARNSRTHSDSQVSKIASSIKEFGFLNPVLIDLDNGIIAGHGRVMAAQKLGLKEVPVLQIGHLSESQKRAYIIADNRLALDAGWDEDMLKLEFNDLANEGFNLDLTGFDLDEISVIFDESKGVQIDNEINEIEDHVFVVKYPLEKKIEVMNLLAESIKNIVGVTLWCDDEQV